MTITFTPADFADLGPELADDCAWLAGMFARHPRHDRRRVMTRLMNREGPTVRRVATRAFNALILAENDAAIAAARKAPPVPKPPQRRSLTVEETAAVLAGLPGPKRAEQLRTFNSTDRDGVRHVLARKYGLVTWNQIITRAPVVNR